MRSWKRKSKQPISRLTNNIRTRTQRGGSSWARGVTTKRTPSLTSEARKWRRRRRRTDLGRLSWRRSPPFSGGEPSRPWPSAATSSPPPLALASRRPAPGTRASLPTFQPRLSMTSSRHPFSSYLFHFFFVFSFFINGFAFF